MTDFLLNAYPWIKTLHILSVISWMAAMLYLPRLFVYHASEAKPGDKMSETFKIMERRLLRGIMTPAMIATWVFGLAMVATPGIIDFQSDIWFYVKLLSIISMTGVHMWLAKQRRRFAEDANIYSGRTYRIINEVPAVLMIIVVVMVIVRPF